jgi:uncharacterized protein (TIGR02001 family)
MRIAVIAECESDAHVGNRGRQIESRMRFLCRSRSSHERPIRASGPIHFLLHTINGKPMKLNKLSFAFNLAMLVLPVSAMAQAASTGTDPSSEQSAQDASTGAGQETKTPAAEASASNLTWNLSATSDYVFRGISQSGRDPALQGGLDYAFGESGFYAGTWASSIDFNDRNGPDIEVDLYTGWNHDISADWNGDISVIRYTYHGARPVYGNVDSNELIGKLAWKKTLTLTAGYANDYANYGYSSLYTALYGSWDIGHDCTFTAGVGHTRLGDNNGSYSDWLLGISRKFGLVQATLNYFDTNSNGPRLSDSLVLSFKISG